MTYRVFLVQQSQKETTEKYIKKKLRRAKKELGEKGIELELSFSPTQDETGSPDIKNSIIEQIKSCDVFVGDLSFIDSEHNISNGNVLYESGVADAFLGEEYSMIEMEYSLWIKECLRKIPQITKKKYCQWIKEYRELFWEGLHKYLKRPFRL